MSMDVVNSHLHKWSAVIICRRAPSFYRRHLNLSASCHAGGSQAIFSYPFYNLKEGSVILWYLIHMQTFQYLLQFLVPAQPRNLGVCLLLEISNDRTRIRKRVRCTVHVAHDVFLRRWRRRTLLEDIYMGNKMSKLGLHSKGNYGTYLGPADSTRLLGLNVLPEKKTSPPSNPRSTLYCQNTAT